MGTFLEYVRIDGLNGLGEYAGIKKQVNKILATIDPVDIVSVTFTTENDEYGVGHGIAHIIKKVWRADTE